MSNVYGKIWHRIIMIVSYRPMNVEQHDVASFIDVGHGLVIWRTFCRSVIY